MRLRSPWKTAGELGIAALAGLAALVATAVAGLSTNLDTELVSFPVCVIGGWLPLYSPRWSVSVFAATLSASCGEGDRRRIVSGGRPTSLLGDIVMSFLISACSPGNMGTLAAPSVAATVTPSQPTTLYTPVVVLPPGTTMPATFIPVDLSELLSNP